MISPLNPASTYRPRTHQGVTALNTNRIQAQIVPVFGSATDNSPPKSKTLWQRCVSALKSIGQWLLSGLKKLAVFFGLAGLMGLANPNKPPIVPAQTPSASSPSAPQTPASSSASAPSDDAFRLKSEAFDRLVKAELVKAYRKVGRPAYLKIADDIEAGRSGLSTKGNVQALLAYE